MIQSGAEMFVCQRCGLPIKVGEPYMPRIPFVAGWGGFDHQYCPLRIMEE